MFAVAIYISNEVMEKSVSVMNSLRVLSEYKGVFVLWMDIRDQKKSICLMPTEPVDGMIRVPFMIARTLRTAAHQRDAVARFNTIIPCVMMSMLMDGERVPLHHTHVHMLGDI